VLIARAFFQCDTGLSAYAVSKAHIVVRMFVYLPSLHANVEEGILAVIAFPLWRHVY